MKKKYYLFQMRTDVLNIFSLLIFFGLILILYLFYGTEILKVFTEGYAVTFILMFPYFIMHEIFHSIAYVLYGADFKNITYGAHLEKGILCCLCKQNISKKNILISLLYPFFFLGVITLIIGLIFKIYPLILLSIMNISGCTGDFIMFYDLIRLNDFEFSEYNNPIAFGLYTDKDLSKEKFTGLKYLEVKDELERDDLQKIRISKISIICFIVIILLGIVNIML